MRKIIVLLSLFIFLSCGKKKDEVFVLKNIHGLVKNDCNDSLLEGIEVKLGVYNESKQIEFLTIITNQEGKFEFKDVKFYESSEYTYKISIDGYSNQDYEFSGLDKQEVAKELFEQEWKIGVTYTFKLLKNVLPNGNFLSENDSISVLFKQPVIHKNQPWKNWEVICTLSSFGNYWMGSWHITVQKWKNGLYSEVQDSIYMGKGETKEYVIPW